MLSSSYDPCPLKLRVRPLVEKLKVNIARVNKGVPFQKMNPNASDIVHVNSLTEIAAKGSALQMQMKGFSHICFFSIQLSTYTSVLQPNPCLTNKTVSQVNSTNTTDNTDNG